MKQLLLLALLSFAAWKGYEHFFAPPLALETPGAGLAPAEARAILNDSPGQPVSTFQCDGRTYCSQMNSLAEAEFFIRHCPGTRMDGNRDGEPCENDSRF